MMTFVIAISQQYYNFTESRSEKGRCQTVKH